MENYKKTLDRIGISYLGGLKHSAKMMKSYKRNVATYCLYLAPATMAGRSANGTRINVCPKSQFCSKWCLNSSGHNKADILSHGDGRQSTINQCRIKKTKLFYDDRNTFMEILIHEIERSRKYAADHGMEFAIRLNGTSDISPERFTLDGKNILEMYPDVQFYDYTKVFKRTELQGKYPNYDVTFSYDGHNWEECEAYLKRGGKVAVVFDSEKMPKTWRGYRVIDANDYDMRYLDPKGCIMGLEFHPIAMDGKVMHANEIDDPFIVKTENNPEVDFGF